MIQSSTQAAQEVATNMGKAEDALHSVANMTITKAGKTTLTVNERAQETNNELFIVAESISTCFKEVTNNIHSVTKEFERTDVELDSSMALQYLHRVEIVDINASKGAFFYETNEIQFNVAEDRNGDKGSYITFFMN